MNPYRVLLVAFLTLAPLVVRAATIEMHVNGLVCAFCAQGIEKKLRKFSATADVLVSLEQRLVAVALKDGQDIPDAELRKALTNAGYTVTAIERSDTPIDAIRSRLGQPKP
jgi:copper chaperone CopZ